MARRHLELIAALSKMRELDFRMMFEGVLMRGMIKEVSDELRSFDSLGKNLS